MAAYRLARREPPSGAAAALAPLDIASGYACGAPPCRDAAGWLWNGQNPWAEVLGALVGMPSPEVVEVLAAAGFDWLFLDTEHGGIDSGDLAALLRAAGDCPCLVRVPACQPPWLARALDAGAAGVIVPQVNSAAIAADMPMGAFAASTSAALPWLTHGFTLLATGSDALLMAAAAQASLSTLRDT